MQCNAIMTPVGATGHRLSCFSASIVCLPAPNLTTQCHILREFLASLHGFNTSTITVHAFSFRPW
jgi:hypothetical protein